ncbi:MAG: SDR family oxidoreductase [Saprospiraceae bacterium]|nr:SDR family oxidoreductase [Lewinella sp.]
MQDKTVFITGGSDGIGRAAALELAHRGMKVIIACRNASSGKAVCHRISKLSQNREIYHIPIDLASQASIHEAVQQFSGRFDQLDVLINNAGVYSSQLRLTEDGYEWHFGINHLGHFLLTRLLKPHLLAAPSPRVVNVSSVAQCHGKIDFENLRGEKGPAAYNGIEAYAQSKLAVMLFTRELARREKRIITNALHPGVVRTRFGNKYSNWKLSLFWTFWKPFMCAPLRGAQTHLYLATDPAVEQISGSFFDEHQRQRELKGLASNDLLARRMWKESCAMTGFDAVML